MVVGIVGVGLAVVVGRVVEVAVPGEDAHPHAVFVDAEGDGAGVGRFVVRAVRRRLRRVRVRVLVGRAGAQRVRRRLERGVGVAQRRARELERVVRRIGAGGWRLVGGGSAGHVPDAASRSTRSFTGAGVDSDLATPTGDDLFVRPGRRRDDRQSRLFRPEGGARAPRASRLSQKSRQLRPEGMLAVVSRRAWRADDARATRWDASR